MAGLRMIVLLSLPALALMAGCAAAPSPAQQAERDACTQQADAAYNAQNYEALSRTDQTGVRYSATPTQVFQAQELGAEHQRDSDITDCLREGSAATSAVPGAPLPAPKIIN